MGGFLCGGEFISQRNYQEKEKIRINQDRKKLEEYIKEKVLQKNF